MASAAGHGEDAAPYEGMGASLSVSRDEGLWTAIFTIPLQPISPMPTD